MRPQAGSPPWAPAGGRVEFVAAEGSFHGRTFGALAVTGNPAKRHRSNRCRGRSASSRTATRWRCTAAVTERTAAVILEPALGEGGVVLPPPGYLAAARAACDASGALLIVDEVQSGIGRTGHWFACIAEGVRPDVLTLGKGLAGGLPIGACLGVGAAGELFVPGDHGSTFGGNPVSCAAALAVLQTIEDERLLDQVKRVGAHLADALAELPGVRDRRGVGLWRALRLSAAVARPSRPQPATTACWSIRSARTYPAARARRWC